MPNIYGVGCDECQCDNYEFKSRQAARRYAAGHARETGHKILLYTGIEQRAHKITKPKLGPDDNFAVYCRDCKRVLYYTDAPDLAGQTKIKTHELYTGHSVKFTPVLPDGTVEA